MEKKIYRDIKEYKLKIKVEFRLKGLIFLDCGSTYNYLVTCNQLKLCMFTLKKAFLKHI